MKSVPPSHPPLATHTRLSALLALMACVWIACPTIEAAEILIHSGQTFEAPSPVHEAQTLRDLQRGIAIQTPFIYEIRWDNAPVAPIDPAALPLPTPGHTQNRVTLFPKDAPPIEGELVRITLESIELRTGTGDSIQVPVADTRLLRFPAPRPWSQFSELAELHDPILEQLFPSLLESPITSEPLIVQRSLRSSVDGLRSEIRRTVERFAGRPDSIPVQAFTAAPDTRLKILHITAIDADGRLYHFVDGQFRMERTPQGSTEMHWTAPHPAEAHLLSTQLEVQYTRAQSSEIDHTFRAGVNARQRLELEVPEERPVDWAVSPGTPIAFSEPEPGRLVWEYQGLPTASDTAHTLHIDWSE